jgi:hypothetical protein
MTKIQEKEALEKVKKMLDKAILSHKDNPTNVTITEWSILAPEHKQIVKHIIEVYLQSLKNELDNRLRKFE